MIYASEHNSNLTVPSFSQAVYTGVAPDGGSWQPASINPLPVAFFNNIQVMTPKEIAYTVVSSVVGDDLSALQVKQLVDHVFSCPVPLVQVSDSTYRLELFHCTTRTHKDFGARFLSKFFELTQSDKPLTVVTTVSESTAKSVCAAFAGQKDIKNILVMEKGAYRRSLQNLIEDQRGVNIIEIAADRRRCESIVQTVLAELDATTANAYNPAIVLVRVIFCFLAYAALRREYDAFLPCASVMPVFVIPGSNPAMLAAARIAAKMGLPMERTILMPDAQIDRFGRYLDEGEIGIALAAFPATLVEESERATGVIRLQSTVSAVKKYLSGVVSASTDTIHNPKNI